jgi:hypothetical protein
MLTRLADRVLDWRRAGGGTFPQSGCPVRRVPGKVVPGEDGRSGFGASALKVDGSIFALLSHGRLVVKLPAPRVAALIAGGTGGPFDAGKGKPMKEWLAVLVDGDEAWMALASEAREFVRSKGH